jgi:hypothetical protein
MYLYRVPRFCLCRQLCMAVRASHTCAYPLPHTPKHRPPLQGVVASSERESSRQRQAKQPVTPVTPLTLQRTSALGWISMSSTNRALCEHSSTHHTNTHTSIRIASSHFCAQPMHRTYVKKMGIFTIAHVGILQLTGHQPHFTSPPFSARCSMALLHSRIGRVFYSK